MAQIDLAAVNIDPSSGSLAVANNLRIAALTVAAYDYFLTLPSEFRLYKTGKRRSLGFILFVLIRYVKLLYSSIIVLVTSNTGFFYHRFTPKTCSHFCYITPTFKAIQLTVSQVILGVRTYNIAQRSLRVGRVIASAFFIVTVFEWFTTFYDRQAEMTDGNCMMGSAHPDQTISAWSFYLAAMLYDCLVLSISTYCLVKLTSATTSTSLKLLNILLYDGLGYLLALTAINLMNIIFYRGVDGAIQSSGASLEYATVWIMSQRILLHLREVRAQQSSHVLSETPKVPASPLHLQRPGGYRNRADGNPAVDIGNSFDTAMSDFNVEVRIERSVIKDSRPADEESADQGPYTPGYTPESKLEKSHWDGAVGDV